MSALPVGEVTVGTAVWLDVVEDSVSDGEAREGSERGDGSVGKLSFIEEPAALGSGTMDEIEDRSERRLPVRAADRTDGSELVEETEGDSRPPASGDVTTYGDGDCVVSCKNFGEALACVPDGILLRDGVAVGVGTGPGEVGRIGRLAAPGVGGGG